MNNKRVCLINYTLNAGGAERHTVSLANYFAEKNIDVSVIILKKGKSFYPLHPAVQLIYPPFKEGSTRFLKAVYFFRTGIFVRKTLTNIQPCVIFNTAFPAYILLFTIGIGIPFYLSVRCDPTIIRRIEMFNIPHKIRHWLYRKSNLIIAQTKYAKEILQNQFNPVPVKVIPNMLPTVSDETAVRENIILSAGRLIKSKGFDLLINIFAELNPTDWRLIILGEGPERKNLQALIEEKKQSDKIFLPGVQSDTTGYYLKSKIFAFTSLSEGFPNVLLEAMASPLACISFDCNAGPRDMINDGQNGFLISMGNRVDYAAKLQLLMQDENLRQRFMSEALKLRSLHHPEKIGAEYLKLIETHCSSYVSIR